jgi:hypothetical protein
MATETPTMIMGAPYVFSKEKRQKPMHVEVVTLVQSPVLCHMGCGLYYIPNLEALMAAGTKPEEVTCPDCHEQPKPWKIGADEEIEISVHLAFGNVQSVEFLRALGPVGPQRLARRPMVFQQPTVASTALVQSLKE